MNITKEQLLKMMPTCKTPEVWATLLSAHLESAGIKTSKQVAYFIAQCGHESMDFNTLTENLNYSEQALGSIFGKYFGAAPKASAAAYARKPEKIANVVYGNRMGNGPESSGDGWKFRGRGLIQCTGKNNYTDCSTFIFGDDTLVKTPDLLMIPENALKSALWYWSKNKLASVEDFTSLTQKINGGQHGAADRVARLAAAQKVLG